MDSASVWPLRLVTELLEAVPPTSFFPTIGALWSLRFACSFDTGMRAAQSVVQFGLRLHPCTKYSQEQRLLKRDEASIERERLQQQHRNRRQQAALKETKVANRQLRTVKKYKKEMLGAAQAKARILTARAELEEANVTYCGDDCCPVVDCLDR